MLKLFAVIFCCLPIIGFAVAHFSKDYRYSPQRVIYQIGVTIVFLFWAINLFGGLINAVFIWTTENLHSKSKVFWMGISLLPIVYLVLLLLWNLILGD